MGWNLNEAAIRQELSNEKGRASGALAFVLSLQSKQENFKTRNGHYADRLLKLSPLLAPKYYLVSPLALKTGAAQGWSIKLTRVGNDATDQYGEYSIVFNGGGDGMQIDCVGGSDPEACKKDLLPARNESASKQK